MFCQSSEPVNAILGLFHVVEVGVDVAQVTENGQQEQHEVVDLEELPGLFDDSKGHFVQVKGSLEFFGSSCSHGLEVEGKTQVVQEDGLYSFVVVRNVAVQFVDVVDGESMVENGKATRAVRETAVVKNDATDG